MARFVVFEPSYATALLAGALAVTACTTGGSSSGSTTSTSLSTTTSFVTVTTAPPEDSTTTDPPAVAPAPTVVLPPRPVGVDGLDLDPVDLAQISVLTPSVEEILPHDRTAVTEGLALIDDSQLVESTGFYGRSTRRVIDLEGGDLVTRLSLAPELYATGVIVLNDEEGLQFSRLEERVQRFRLDDLSLLDEQRLATEVNGACSDSESEVALSTADGEVLIVSTASLEVQATITPLVGEDRLPALGDLACVEDAVWGIVSGTSVVVEFDRTTGAVTSLSDLAGLTPAGLAATDVLSGIAFRPSSNTWFVTGKRWDVLYEISLEQ